MSGREAPQTEWNGELARSLCLQADDLHDRAEYAAARVLYERALTIQERVAGTEHPDTARCLHGLARVQMRQDEDTQAGALLERALAIQQKTLGPEHPDTAAIQHTLGELRSNQGDVGTALELITQAFITKQLTLGSDHPDTIESMILLALVLAQQGDTPNAIRQMEHVLSVCEPALGEDHRTTARALNGLGRLYAASEQTYVQARSLYERALTIYERLLGPDHPQTALVLNNLAALLGNMEEIGAALPLLERSLAVHEQIYGAGNWRTSFVLVNVADLHSAQEEYAVARPLLERALIIRERTWGARHPQTVTCLRKLVAVLGNLQEQRDEGAWLASMALVPCLTSLQMAIGQLEPDDVTMPGSFLHPEQAAERLHRLLTRMEADLAQPPISAEAQETLEAAQAMALQADEHLQQEDYDSAALQLEKALRIREGVLGENHLGHIALLRRLVRTREMQEQHTDILPLLQRIEEIHTEVLEEDHPATAIALSELMIHYAVQGDRDAARALQQRILRSMERTLGPEDPRVKGARRTFDLVGEQSEYGDSRQ